MTYNPEVAGSNPFQAKHIFVLLTISFGNFQYPFFVHYFYQKKPLHFGISHSPLLSPKMLVRNSWHLTVKSFIFSLCAASEEPILYDMCIRLVSSAALMNLRCLKRHFSQKNSKCYRSTTCTDRTSVCVLLMVSNISKDFDFMPTKKIILTYFFAQMLEI